MNDIESLSMKGGGGSKMPHSHSTPAGVDGGSRTPPATPRKAGKMLAVRVQMLDDTITMFQVQAKALGRVLFDQVCKQLHLLEADYFGLEYQETNGTKYWLDLEKPVCRQVGLSLVDPLLRFCVKFYTPDPAQLEEEFTRYLFCLQIKRDLAQGLLQCNDNTAALMASYIVQAECGDYVIEDYPDHTYLSTYKFVPHQDQELERRIMENHKKHAGQSPAEADLNLLETARRCELYGMKMHPAKDHEGVPLNLAVAHMGIVVFQNYTKINTFSWAKIRKISFKRKRFLIKLHPEGYGYYKDTVEFFFEGRNECKNFWKKCVENHGFFRCSVVKRVVRQKTRVLSRGSSFRYSGKTQKQIVEFVRDNYVKRQTFQRSNSFRQTSGGRALQGTEGGGYRGATSSSSLMGSSSISAHPLLPLGDPALATPALSLSCGSMTLDSPTTATSVSMGGTIHRRDDTATSFRTLTSIDVHSPATPSRGQAPSSQQLQQLQQQQQPPPPVSHQQIQHHTSSSSHQERITSAGRISPSNGSPPEFPRPIPRHPWQRSASCRELYASSFEDSGRARSKDERSDKTALEPFQLPSQGELDNPVTRYDESNRSYSAASSKLPSLDHDSVPERVYSSSYPGTSSLSTESGHEESGPAGDLSHDDLSHDSYELLEREHEFEYPESYSSPPEDNEPLSDNSDEGIEHEMFQMDSETDSVVAHRSVKSSVDKKPSLEQQRSRTKSIDRYSTVSKTEGDLVITESRIHRSSTQIERKFETRHANSLEQTKLPQQQSKEDLKKDPVVLQVQRQKMTMLNELKNLKPKYKITHVDSEILRDEGIMRPKSRIDDDSSPGERDHRGRTRARSIASLEDHLPRSYVETGSLGRGHKAKRPREAESTKVEKLSKDRRSIEDRKRMERDYSRECRCAIKKESSRRDNHSRRLDRDMTELRRSIERLNARERSYERLDSKEKNAFYGDSYETRHRSVERLDYSSRGSTEHLKSPREKRHFDAKERREKSAERLDSRERKSPGGRASFDHQRHTLERFDSGNRSPFERLSSKEPRGKSVERLDSHERPTFDFDPRAIERLKSLEHVDFGYETKESRSYERRESLDRRSLKKSDSRDRKSFERLDSKEGRGYERKSLEKLDSKDRGYDRKDSSVDRKSLERLDSRDAKDNRSFDWNTLSSADRKILERISLKDGSRSYERKSLEKLDSREAKDDNRSHDRRELSSVDRRSVEKLDSRDRKHHETRSIDVSDYEPSDWPDHKDSKKSKMRSEKAKSEEKPRERDDWKSLEKARKDDERRERERQARLSLESRTETVIGVPREMENKNKAVFGEYEPKVVGGVVLGFDENVLTAHTPVERTKSDPNPGRQRLGSNSKRHMLMHQKSIDLTPADSGDEDPFSDHAVTQKSNIDIPYTLHKRHVMNGTASDEKSESDSSKTSKTKPKDLPKLPLKMITDITCFDLTKLTSVEKKGSPDKPKSILSPNKSKSILSPSDKPKSILSPSDKPKSILSPSKLSPTDAKSFPSPVKGILSPSRSPDKLSKSEDRPPKPAPKKLMKLSSEPIIVAAIEKRSPKVSPTDPSVTIVSVIQKKKSPDSGPRSPSNAQKAQEAKAKIAFNFADVVGLEMKQKLERKNKEKESLPTPEESLEKQDSIENIPLPEIPVPASSVMPVETETIVRSAEPPEVPPPDELMALMDEPEEPMFIPEIPREPSPEKMQEPEETEKLHEPGKVEEPEKVDKPEKPEKPERPEKPEKPEKLEKPRILEKPKIPEKPKNLERPKLPEKPLNLEKPSIPEKTKRILERIESKFSEVNKNSATKVARPKIIDTGFDDFVDPVADLPLDEVPVKPALELDSLKVPEFMPFMLRPHAEPLRSKSLSLAEEKAPIDTLLSPEVENKVFIQDVSPKKAKKAKAEQKKDFKKQSKSLEGDKPPLKKVSSKESRPQPPKIDKSKLKLGEMPQEIIIIDSTDVAPEVSIIQKGRSKSVTRLSDKPFSTSKEEKEDPKNTRAKSASVDDDLMKGALKTEKRPKSLGISKSLGSTEKKDSVERISPKRTITKAKEKAGLLKEVKQEIRRSREKDDVPEKGREKEKEFKVEPEKDTRELKEVKDAKEAKDMKESKESKESKELKESKDSKDPKKISQELTESPLVLRKPGQTPILFARARLGLSEGSGIGALQRQGATQSPTSQRRAKSLDAPVISVHRLPPTNAFSSKDDTVDVSEPIQGEEQETTAPKQSIQMEASPNHRSDSTDHTVPEICTDSLSVTETSAQYLESPLTECNEMVTCADLIPYETEGAQLFMSCVAKKEAMAAAKLEGATRYIDQSSVESGDQEVAQEPEPKIAPLKMEPDFAALSSKLKAEIDAATQRIRKQEELEEMMKAESKAAESVLPTVVQESKEALPDVTVSGVTEEDDQMRQGDDFQNMVKSPIQISIEECSDEELQSEQEEEEEEDEDLDHQDEDNRPLDSGDTSEDTLDALDTQVQMRGADSELSSPDYGVDQTDEKTLVVVELTLEYLEKRKEGEEGPEELPEELPEDEPEPKVEEKKDTNRLGIDKKLRLSTERSRSEETNTWTPDREDPDSSSCSIARPLGIGQIQSIIDRREIAMIKDARNGGGSLEDDSSGSHAPKMELSSTWKPFPLESSGSSSLEDGWMPQDDNNAHQSQSEDSNGQNEDSFQEDLADFPGGFIYPVGPDILANYGAFSLSRTLSRISERSTTSEQDKSDLEDSFKPSSRSPSLDDESLISSDHQPSLSSDPPSGTALPSVSDDRRTSSELPDIPIDAPEAQEDESKSPRSARRSRLQLQSSEDWPSPPSSPIFDTPVVSHVETFYMEIKPEEAVKVTVTDSTDTPVRMDRDSDSSDENRTLHDDLHSTLLEDGQSSTSATTVDGTVKIVVKPKSNSYITGSSHSEDTSMGLSMSEWSSSNNTVRQFCQYSGTKSDDNSLAELGASISDWSGSTTVIPQPYYSNVTVEKSQSDTTTSEKSVTSMRPNSKCQSSSHDSPPIPPPSPPPPLPPPPPPPLPPPESEMTDDASEDTETIREHDYRGARKFIESQFDEHRRQRRQEDDQGSGYVDISPPRITFQNEHDETVDDIGVDDIIHEPIPEEDEREQLYDNVPAMRYSSGNQTRMEVVRGASPEDMHEKYADLATGLVNVLPSDDWSFEDRREEEEEEDEGGTFEQAFRESPSEVDGYRDGSPESSTDPGRYQGTRSSSQDSSMDPGRQPGTRSSSQETSMEPGRPMARSISQEASIESSRYQGTRSGSQETPAELSSRHPVLRSSAQSSIESGRFPSRSSSHDPTLEPSRYLSSRSSTFDQPSPEASIEQPPRYQSLEPRHGTRSTERPVIVPIRAKSTPYYSTTSLSGESTTSSPPMQVRAQIRTKTMPYSSSRSPQSEGDTSSSMDSPGHTPDRGQRAAFRRKRQQNIKRRHRVVVDLEVKDGQIISSTDSSFDVANIPPPLFTEGQGMEIYDEDNDDDDDEMSETREEQANRRRQDR